MSGELAVLLIGAAGAAGQAVLLAVQVALERKWSNAAPPEGTMHGRAEGSTPSGAEKKRG